MKREGNTYIQTYTGYLYQTEEPIFQGHGAPEEDPTFRLLAGYSRRSARDHPLAALEVDGSPGSVFSDTINQKIDA
jgi:hypothetical protein